ncbi:Synaptic vesicle glycoprotein 2A [Eumeta japonica]|uniref:Synaptic vesicle glycoprotein 2A n=1 Tax=Eumeta variegata TaxID=151549 RepID=A0A4C1TWH4_EUMVA|nr:Synaptic vesicle glycoprotein 2A [Eumeta japonica]
MACPASVPYAYIGELLPARHRDLALSITNAMQTLGSALVPLLAWAIIPRGFRLDFGIYEFRSWRLLVLAYSSIFVICGILLCFAPESPKYLVSKGKNEEALKILRMMYAKNKNKTLDEYPVLKLKSEEENGDDKLKTPKASFVSSLRDQTLPILKPPYVKWLALNGFLLFGVFATLNGLFMWVPDVLNRVLSESTGSDTTACQVIRARLEQVNVDLVFAALLSSLQITALAIGPVNAYTVEIFPTHIRGMAVSLSLMLGRLGSVIGTNAAGLLINANCELTFYLFGGLLILCGLLSCLLPKSQIK